MKKILLLSGLLMASSSFVQAFDGMPPGFSPGSMNPAMSPAAFGAYEMQLMKDQRQREYINEDFKLYQRKKELEKTGEVDPSIINDQRDDSDIDLQSESEANNTFLKRVRNRSKANNSKLIQQNGKVMVKEEPAPNAKEIKVKDKTNVSEPATQDEFQKPAVEIQENQNVTENEIPVNEPVVAPVKPDAMKRIYEPQKTDDSKVEQLPMQDEDAPKIKEDTLSSSKPVVKQAKPKPWLNEISPDVPTVEAPSFEDNFEN